MSQVFFQLPCALVEVTQLAEILYTNAEGYFIVHWGEGGGRRREKKEEKRKKKIKERKKRRKKKKKMVLGFLPANWLTQWTYNRVTLANL